jgi:hypothetical protein
MSIPATGLGDDGRLVVSPRRARHMLDCGNTRLYELLKDKKLESYVDGRSRKIITASIHRYVAQRLKEAQSTDESATGAAAERRDRPAKVRSSESAAP